MYKLGPYLGVLHTAIGQSAHSRNKWVHALMNALPQEAQPELKLESRLTSKLTGFKNRLLKASAKPRSGLDESYSGASGATQSCSPGSEPSPLDSAYNFGALVADKRDAGADASTAASAASRPSIGGSLLVDLHCCFMQSQGMPN